MRQSSFNIIRALRASLNEIASSWGIQNHPAFSALLQGTLDKVDVVAIKHNWRLIDLFATQSSDVLHARRAALFIQDFWVEVKDHAPHQVQVVCPGLPFAAIHRVWEFGRFAWGGHFAYGSFLDFGYRNRDSLLEAITNVDTIPAELAPGRISRHKRATWDIARARRTLLKESDPSNAHRPLCNRENYLTAALDFILCRAGVAGLCALDVSEHLDVDAPSVVVAAFRELSGHVSPSASVVLLMGTTT